MTRVWRVVRGLVWGSLFVIATTAFAVEDFNTPLDRFFSDLRSLSANFDQTILDAEGNVTQHANGRLSIHRPGRFRWDYETPYRQVVLGDGERLWTYDADLEQAMVRKQEAALAGTPALLLSAGEQPGELFRIAALPSRDGEQWFLLTPKSDESLGDTQFNELRLGFRGDDLRAMELIDGFEQTTRIRFSGVERNLKLAPELFDFRPPAGVDVIGEP